MTPIAPNVTPTRIRSVQYRDLEALIALNEEAAGKLQSSSVNGLANHQSCSVVLDQQLRSWQRWYSLLKVISWFPNPLQYRFCMYVAHCNQKLQGFIQISPFNSSRSTWQVQQVVIAPPTTASGLMADSHQIGSQLLRHCLETIWEARTWVLEANIHQKDLLALYRQNGFQPLAQMTYWSLGPEVLRSLSQQELDIPGLMSVSNADAPLLYQLDCVSMPPLLRQVFDRHIQDFKTSVLKASFAKCRQWLNRNEVVGSYVFEPQRKAAIGYFQLALCQDGSQPHQAKLTVHPAYTWLYPKLLTQMAKLIQGYPPQAIELASADYQPEREEYLEQLQAVAVERTLLMSRSVWHKLKESKPLEALQRSMLKGLQAAPRTPIPSRWSLPHPLNHYPGTAATSMNPPDATDSPSDSLSH